MAEDKADPVLSLIISAVTDDDVPNAVAYNPYLTLKQQVHIDGLEQPLVVPTYSHVIVVLDAEKNLARSINTPVDLMLRRFIARRDRAASHE